MMNVPYLKKIDRMDLTRLAGTLGSNVYQPGDVVIKSGDTLSYVYLVEKGQLLIRDGPPVAHDVDSKQGK